MKKHKIMLDLDDTIGDLKDGIIHSMNTEFKQSLTSEDIKDYYDITGMYGLDDDEYFFTTLEKYNVLEKMQPREHSKDIINMLHDDFYIHIVTSRGWHPKGEDITYEWFEEHGIKYDKIDIVKMHKNKSFYLNDKYDFSFDDNPHVCRELHSSGKVDKVVLVGQPWNEMEKEFIKAHDWKQKHEIITKSFVS